MENVSVAGRRNRLPFTSGAAAAPATISPEIAATASAPRAAFSEENVLQTSSSEKGGKSDGDSAAAFSQQEIRLSEMLRRLLSFRVTSLFSGASTPFSTLFPSTATSRAPSGASSASSKDTAAPEAREALSVVLELGEKDFQCNFSDSPFSAADRGNYPFDGSPQHVVFPNTQGLLLHGYFWYPPLATSNPAYTASLDQHPCCSAVCADGEKLVPVNSSCANVCTPEEQHQRPQESVTQVEQQQSPTNERHKVDSEDGDNKFQNQRKRTTEWERACASALYKGVVILLHGYCGHARLSYLKKILPKDYVRQHPSWGSYVTTVPSTTTSLSCGIFRPSFLKYNQNNSGINRSARSFAAVALAEALAPCDVVFSEHATFLSQAAGARAQHGTTDIREERTEMDVKRATTEMVAVRPPTGAETLQGCCFVSAAAAGASNIAGNVEEAVSAVESGRESLGTALLHSTDVIPARDGEDEQVNARATDVERKGGAMLITEARPIMMKAAFAGEQISSPAVAGEGSADDRDDDSVEQMLQQQGQSREKTDTRSLPVTTTPLYEGSWVEALTREGFIVAALDMQGHGLSEGWGGRQATIRRFDDFAVDVIQFAHIVLHHCRYLRGLYFKHRQQKEKHRNEEKRLKPHQQLEKHAEDMKLREEQQQRLYGRNKLQREAHAHSVVESPSLAIKAGKEEETGVEGEAPATSIAIDEAEKKSGVEEVPMRATKLSAEAGANLIVGAREQLAEAAQPYQKEGGKDLRSSNGKDEGEGDENADDPPLFLMGVSLGGAVALRTVQLLCEAAMRQNIVAFNKELPSGACVDGKEVFEDDRMCCASLASSAENADFASTETRREKGAMHHPSCRKQAGTKHSTNGRDVPEHGNNRHRKTERNLVRFQGCVLLSPMLDLGGVAAKESYYHSLALPMLRRLKKYVPHAVITRSHADVKYPYQQQMMTEDPYTYKGGVRVSMASAMLDATEQLVSQEQLRCMQAQHACCPSLLIVHNFFDTTCGFRGCVKLMEELPTLGDNSLLLLNAFVKQNNSSSTTTTTDGSRSSSKKSSRDSSENTVGDRNGINSSAHGDAPVGGDGDGSSSSIRSYNSHNINTDKWTSSNNISSQRDFVREERDEACGNEWRDDDVYDACAFHNTSTEGDPLSSKIKFGGEASIALSKVDPLIASATSSEAPLLGEEEKEGRTEQNQDTSQSRSSLTVATRSEMSRIDAATAETFSDSETATDGHSNDEQHSGNRSSVGCGAAGRQGSGVYCDSSAAWRGGPFQGRNAHENERSKDAGGSSGSYNSSSAKVSVSGVTWDATSETAIGDETKYAEFLSTVPTALKVDIATLKKLQVYTHPDLHNLDVFHGLPSDPESEVVLQRVLMWLQQRSSASGNR